MSNALFHNKWHGFNHYTLPVPGFPDSGTDPIASLEYPFRGTFYNSLEGDFGNTVKEITITDAGSGYSHPPSILLNPLPGGNILYQPTLSIGINSETKQISSIDVIEGGRYFSPVNLLIIPFLGDIGYIKRTLKLALSGDKFKLNSDSYGWWYYSSLTQTFSSEWELYPSVLSTTLEYSGFWYEGYLGYLNQYELSAKWESTFIQTSGLSGEDKYDFKGGTGWHIALSSITHRLNVPDQIDIAQKVAVPVRLYEDSDYTVVWKTSAQTVYYNLTGNYTLTATDVFDARKGGKYKMWLYVDACPEEKMNFVFDKEKYNITVKGWDEINETWFDTLNNVLLLSANSITRIDFVYDGYKMLGRATRYRVFLDQTDDLYFMGTGLRFVDPLRTNRIKNPVFISNQDPIYGNSFLNIPIEDDTNRTGIFIDDYYENFPDNPDPTLRSNFDANSSFYIAGSGIFMRYLGANNNYFSFNSYGANFQSESTLTKFRELTSSFDRITLTLSGGNWTDPVYAENLVTTPDVSILSPTMSAALPQPPYLITSSNIRTVAKCTSSFTVEIYSGKDRDISNIFVNQVNAPITPIVIDGMRQTYNFNNERTCLLSYERIQQDFTIDVYFVRQVPNTISQNLLSFNSMNQYSLKSQGSLLTTWENGVVTNNIKLEQLNTSFAPTIVTDRALRHIKFENNKFLTSNLPVTALSSNNINYFNSFTTFTVFKTDVFPISSVIWWLGDFTGTTEQKGYGLVLSASNNNSLTARLFTVSNYESMGKIRNSLRDVTTIEAGKTYVVCTNYDPLKKGKFRQEIYVNNRFSVYQRNLGIASKFNEPLTNLNLVFGKNPNNNTGYSNVKIYDFYLFNKSLSREEIIRMNRFLIEKINGYTLV